MVGGAARRKNTRRCCRTRCGLLLMRSRCSRGDRCLVSTEHEMRSSSTQAGMEDPEAASTPGDEFGHEVAAVSMNHGTREVTKNCSTWRFMVPCAAKGKAKRSKAC